METHPPTSGSSLIAAAIAVIVHGLLGWSLVLAMVFVVPQFRREYRDYQISLPYMTIWLVEVSDWFSAYWYVAALATLPMLALDGLIVYWSWSKNWTRPLGILWIILWVVLCFLFAAFVAYCLWLANLKIREALAR